MKKFQMTKEELIAELEKLPDGIAICPVVKINIKNVLFTIKFNAHSYFEGLKKMGDGSWYGLIVKGDSL